MEISHSPSPGNLQNPSQIKAQPQSLHQLQLSYIFKK